MERITRNVRDLDSDERRVYENAVGHQLRENQQIIVQVITIGDLTQEPETAAAPNGSLPEWCNVYSGLSEAEIAEVEGISLQRSDLSRPSD